MNAAISGLILARRSLVVFTGFHPIDLDLFAAAREFVPRNDEPLGNHSQTCSGANLG